MLFAISALLLFSLCVNAALILTWLSDKKLLKGVAEDVVKYSVTPLLRIDALTHWVFHNQGFGKNKGYFLWRKLGPTPVQVLEKGGDCADKSRLLSAMLAEIGIESGLVIVFSENRQAIHTVVEAVCEGRRIVLDPVWGVVYAEEGTTYGLADMIGTDIGSRIVQRLVSIKGPESKVAHMPINEMCFDHAKPVNFDKGGMLRFAASLIDILGGDHRTILRPRLLEDPKRFLVITSSASSFFLLALLGWANAA